MLPVRLAPLFPPARPPRLFTLLPSRSPCTYPLQVNGRYIKKRIHVRIEHVTPSRCHEEFLRRCKENDAARHEAKVGAGCWAAQHSCLWPGWQPL